MARKKMFQLIELKRVNQIKKHVSHMKLSFQWRLASIATFYHLNIRPHQRPEITVRYFSSWFFIPCLLAQTKIGC